jgi:hypothetical protein
MGGGSAKANTINKEQQALMEMLLAKRRQKEDQEAMVSQRKLQKQLFRLQHHQQQVQVQTQTSTQTLQLQLNRKLHADRMLQVAGNEMKAKKRVWIHPTATSTMENATSNTNLSKQLSTVETSATTSTVIPHADGSSTSISTAISPSPSSLLAHSVDGKVVGLRSSVEAPSAYSYKPPPPQVLLPVPALPAMSGSVIRQKGLNSSDSLQNLAKYITSSSSLESLPSQHQHQPYSANVVFGSNNDNNSIAAMLSSTDCTGSLSASVQSSSSSSLSSLGRAGAEIMQKSSIQSFGQSQQYSQASGMHGGMYGMQSSMSAPSLALNLNFSNHSSNAHKVPSLDNTWNNARGSFGTHSLVSTIPSTQSISNPPFTLTSSASNPPTQLPFAAETDQRVNLANDVIDELLDGSRQRLQVAKALSVCPRPVKSTVAVSSSEPIVLKKWIAPTEKVTVARKTVDKVVLTMEQKLQLRKEKIIQAALDQEQELLRKEQAKQDAILKKQEEERKKLEMKKSIEAAERKRAEDMKNSLAM